MNWIQEYQLFLFDFDGLLVDTKRLHYAAYKELCRRHVCELKWDFERFCQEAHRKAMGVWDGLKREFPSMFESGHDIGAFYEEKKSIYVDLLKTSPLELMQGAGELLQALQIHQIKRAVVTNSPKAHVELIKASIPLLNSIPLWITREDYAESKPSPEGYLKAIESLGKNPNDRIIGFEDTLKGLKALLAAGAESILVCPAESGHVAEGVALGAKHRTNLVLHLKSF